MTKDMRILKKRIDLLTKDDLYQLIRDIREITKVKTNKRKALEFIDTLQLVLEHFSERKDFNSQRIILYQLFEIVWWARDNPKAIDTLVRNISTVLLDSRSSRGIDRVNFFSDLSDMLTRFTRNEKVYKTISMAAVELIKWGTDKEILDILDVIQEKSANYPLIETIQLLDAKVFMNTLFYLVEEDCKTIMKIYRKFSCFSLSSYDMSADDDCKDISPVFGEDINELLQEGVINAIINMARINKRSEEICEECISNIKEIINDSDYLLRNEGKVFLKDIYRLSVTFDQYKLWDFFLEIPLVAELKTERDKNEKYQIAESKLLAIIKNMRIEEYDSLKIGRRGIVLEYDINNLDDIQKIYQQLILQDKNSLKSIDLVSEVDALIAIDDELTEQLRKSGDIPADKKTINEIQDLTSKSDDLTLPAMKESRIIEQLKFLKQLELTDERFLINLLLHTKALTFAVAMFGFNSSELKITRVELLNHIDVISERKMIIELIDPIIRAITLRAARLDGEAVNILFKLLNSKGLKFLPKYYKQYNFIQNLMRLLSYLARQGQIDLLIDIKNEIEKANSIWINDDTISLKIARAINEGILSFEADDIDKKLSLLKVVKELAKVNSYEIDLQIKYIEALNFLILDVENFNWKNESYLFDELLEFARIYRNNQLIEEKAALGLLWSSAIARIYKQNLKYDHLKKEIQNIASTYPDSIVLKKIIELKNHS
ncbi:MAG: hypothetical protein FK733_01505 [Asgard group archaeon]|nr:hypothetical protein [Asgard group archaeon]